MLERGGEVARLVTVHRIREVPRDPWATAIVVQAMIPMAELKWVRPAAS